MTLSTATPSRRQRQRQATITEILDAARAQMRSDGAGALNLNGVAHQVGLRPPSLYEYFPGGKHEIYDTLFRLGITIYAGMVQPTLEIEEPATMLRQSMEAYLRFAIEYPELYQLCFERPVPGFVPSAESLRLSFDLLGSAHAAAAGLLARTGNPLGLTTDQVQNLTIAIMHGIAALHLANEPHLPHGEGRFGSLIPAATAVLCRALAIDLEPPASEGDPA